MAVIRKTVDFLFGTTKEGRELSMSIMLIFLGVFLAAIAVAGRMRWLALIIIILSGFFSGILRSRAMGGDVWRRTENEK